MRVYHAADGDTLRKIATQYYEVCDIEGIEDEGLINQVLDKLVQKNPSSLSRSGTRTPVRRF